MHLPPCHQVVPWQQGLEKGAAAGVESTPSIQEGTSKTSQGPHVQPAFRGKKTARLRTHVYESYTPSRPTCVL